MAISMRRAAKPAGRPKIAADIEPTTDKAIEKRDAFFKICQTLSYRDKVHLANGLGVAFRTVERWYYGYSLPDEQIREDVERWYERGKPLKRLSTCDGIIGIY